MKHFVIIHGPPASGKMTIGEALCERLGYKLFFNHMSLDLVNHFFDFGSAPFKRLDKIIRFSLFEEIAKSDIPGLVFTYVWAINEQSDEDYIDTVSDIFKKEGAQVSIVELQCALDERLERNKHPHRLSKKPSKRDLALSEQNVLYFEKHYRMLSTPDDFPDKDILRIDNSAMTPEEVVDVIIEYFKLT